MDFATFLIQCLNGLQYGLLLFLVASGLTLIFGIMGIINLAHGSFYMIGAYMAWSLSGLDRQPDGRAILLAIPLPYPRLGLGLVPPPLPARAPAAGADDLRPDPGLRGAAQPDRGDDVHGVPPPGPAWPARSRWANLMTYPVYRCSSRASACCWRGLWFV
jgi:branched-chain amino acid transport system permease protein